MKHVPPPPPRLFGGHRFTMLPAESVHVRVRVRACMCLCLRERLCVCVFVGRTGTYCILHLLQYTHYWKGG